jgi:hypothetical protein
VFLAAALLVAVSALKAQEYPKNAFKMNPLSLIVLTGNVAYERAVADNQSVQLGVFFTGATLFEIKYSGWGITPEYRIYVAGNKQVLNGVYIGPFLRYRNFHLRERDGDSEAEYSSVGGGLVLGMEKTLASRFVLDLFLGPQFTAPTFKHRTGNEDFERYGLARTVGLRTGITLGFAF